MDPPFEGISEVNKQELAVIMMTAELAKTYIYINNSVYHSTTTTTTTTTITTIKLLLSMTRGAL